jgi:hypothetical protein
MPMNCLERITTVPVSDPPQFAPVSSRRTSRERIRDALDPAWRRLLWAIAVRRTGARLARTPCYDTRIIHLEGEAADRAREVLARRLTR